MYKHIEEKISEMTGSEIMTFKNRIGIYFFSFLFMLLGLYLFFAILDIPILYWIAILMIPIAFLFFLPVMASIDSGYKKILTEHLDLDRYQEIFEKQSSFKSRKAGAKSTNEKIFIILILLMLSF